MGALAGHSLQSGLREDNREIGALFARISTNYGKSSHQSRLRGGAGSLALTLLRPNSLVTGNLTGNFEDFSLRKPHSLSLSCTVQGRERLRVENRAGNFQRWISELISGISDGCSESHCEIETCPKPDYWTEDVRGRHLYKGEKPNCSRCSAQLMGTF